MSPGKSNSILIFFYLSVCIFLLSCEKKEKSYFEAISLNDVQLSKPTQGEWRYDRNEKFQTFADFQKMKKIKPEPGKKYNLLTAYRRPQ